MRSLDSRSHQRRCHSVYFRWVGEECRRFTGAHVGRPETTFVCSLQVTYCEKPVARMKCMKIIIPSFSASVWELRTVAKYGSRCSVCIQRDGHTHIRIPRTHENSFAVGGHGLQQSSMEWRCRATCYVDRAASRRVSFLCIVRPDPALERIRFNKRRSA